MLIRVIITLYLLLQPLIGFAETVKEVQEMLGTLGYLTGRADGIWGNKSKEALKRFQTANALPATGSIDTQTTLKLKSVASAIAITTPPAAQQPQTKRDNTDTTVQPTPAAVISTTPKIAAEPQPPVVVNTPALPYKPTATATAVPLAPANAGVKDANIIESPAGISFVRIPGGCFVMGDNRENDSQPHEVCVHIGGNFWLGQYEITQQQWLAITGSNPATFKDNLNYPVETVSWNDVQNFIAQLNAKGQGKYRLPTEAEWEYSARAGSKAAYWWGDAAPVCDPTLPNGANFQGGAKCLSSTTPVGTYKPNPFGLYDVHGNVWEWVEDVYKSDAYAHHSKNDPVVTEEGADRVFRGGGWLHPAAAATAFHRDHAATVFHFSHLGLRLIYEPIVSTK